MALWWADAATGSFAGDGGWQVEEVVEANRDFNRQVDGKVSMLAKFQVQQNGIKALVGHVKSYRGQVGVDLLEIGFQLPDVATSLLELIREPVSLLAVAMRPIFVVVFGEDLDQMVEMAPR